MINEPIKRDDQPTKVARSSLEEDQEDYRNRFTKKKKEGDVRPELPTVPSKNKDL